MSVQVLDLSIVVVLEQPPSNIANLTTSPAGFFETEEFADLLEPALIYSQGLVVDPATRSATVSLQADSMRSRMTVSIAPTRLDVHDRSGEISNSLSTLPKLLSKVANKLGVVHIKEVGANIEIQFTDINGEKAAKSIALGVFPEVARAAPYGLDLIGGTARLSLVSRDGATYTVSIEPRYNDPSTKNIWMTCNYSILSTIMPEPDQLTSMLDGADNVVHHIRRSLFQDDEGSN